MLPFCSARTACYTTYMFKEPEKKHILIIEDETDLRESLKVSLIHSGYEVTTVENTELALKQLSSIKPDLILLDILTESMDASIFLQRLRNLPSELRDTKVIILTNLDDTATREKMQQHDIERYLVKVQVSLQDILDSIDTALLPLDKSDVKNNSLEL